ncbi:MAG: hypothetical protein ACTH2Y_04875 [Corynebacterium sp.]|uniref:hypothetical protein n=1 Tax=unclassified Corynebacterium TaxID=2624378 RepID=UPI003F8E3AA7
MQSQLTALQPALPDPADVPDGGPWLVSVDDGEPAPAFKADGPGWIVYWERGNALPVGSERITLVARLTAERPARAIDRPEDLDALPAMSVVVERDGAAWQKRPFGPWDFRDWQSPADGLLARFGPVTVAYTPEEPTDDE